MAVRRWMSGTLGVIGLTALATGCVDDGVSLHAVCPVPPDVQDDACVWDPGSDVCVAEGVLNLFVPGVTYRLNLKVESGLKPRMRDVPPLGEPNGLQIMRAHVELRLANGAAIDFRDPAFPNGFWVTTSGYVDPMGSVIVPITVVPNNYAQKLSVSLGQVVAAVKLFGTTNGNEDVESGEFNWPIRLIQKSTLQVMNQCIVGISYCVGSLGQDGFAEVCQDSASSAN